MNPYKQPMTNLTAYGYGHIWAILLAGCHSSSEGKTPKGVKATFKSIYPGENDPDWHKDKNGNFESNFKQDGNHYKADFSPGGKWIETERRIKRKELPKPILTLLKKEYTDYEIVEIEKVEHFSKGLFYDVEFKKDGNKRDIEFSPSGGIIH